MPKQPKPRKKTIQRVMHEFKHGKLESGSGKKVKSRTQAIAIGLKETGESKKRKRTKKKERK